MNQPKNQETGLIFHAQAPWGEVVHQLTCAKGDLLALVGPSGAGKSTLLRQMAGLMRPSMALMRVDGEVWCDTKRGIWRSPQQRQVGMVFQHFGLLPHLTALQNVLLGMPKDAQPRAKVWLQEVGLQPSEQQRKPNQLSGGQCQRVGLIRALIRQPKLLLMDEPFSAVDHLTRGQLYELLAKLRPELACPMILVTHDLQEAKRLADHIAVMMDGQILQVGRSHRITHAPRNAQVADLVGIRNRYQGIWRGHGFLDWLGTPWQLQVPDKGRIDAPQQVSWLVPASGWHTTAQDGVMYRTFQARVIQNLALGELHQVTLHFVETQDTLLRLELGAGQAQGWGVGDVIAIDMDLSKVHIMPLKNI